MAKAPENAVTVKEDSALPAEMMEEFLGGSTGHEDFSSSDFSVPYISIVQALSKARQKTHANYVKGAEEGMFLNSASRKTYSGETGIIVVPFAFRHRYTAWKPGNEGIAQDYGEDATVYNSIIPVADGKEKGKRLDADGNEVTDSGEYFLLIVDPETGMYEPGVMGFSKGFMKNSKRWNNLIRERVVNHKGRMVRPPIFFYAYRITTKPESNDQGEWYTHQIELHGSVSDLPNGLEILQTAKNLRDQLQAGELKAAPVEQDADGEKAPTAF